MPSWHDLPSSTVHNIYAQLQNGRNAAAFRATSKDLLEAGRDVNARSRRATCVAALRQGLDIVSGSAPRPSPFDRGSVQGVCLVVMFKRCKLVFRGVARDETHRHGLGVSCSKKSSPNWKLQETPCDADQLIEALLTTDVDDVAEVRLQDIAEDGRRWTLFPETAPGAPIYGWTGGRVRGMDYQGRVTSTHDQLQEVPKERKRRRYYDSDDDSDLNGNIRLWGRYPSMFRSR